MIIIIITVPNDFENMDLIKILDEALATDHIYTQSMLTVIIIIVIIVDVGFIKIGTVDDFRKRLC